VNFDHWILLLTSRLLQIVQKLSFTFARLAETATPAMMEQYINAAIDDNLDVNGGEVVAADAEGGLGTVTWTAGEGKALRWRNDGS
jgi:hypothetical protein